MTQTGASLISALSTAVFRSVTDFKMHDATSHESARSGPTPRQNLLKPTTFHRFSDLPIEIQNLIWGYLETEPRIIIENQESGGISFGAPYGPQVVLHVSSKAREEGLRRFRPVLASGTGAEKRYYHVDFSRDIFLLQRFREDKMEGSEWGSGIYWNISYNERTQLIRTVAVDTYLLTYPPDGTIIANVANATSYSSDGLTPQIWIGTLVHLLGPRLGTNSALERVLVVSRPRRGVARTGELGFVSLEKEAQWLSDFRSYGSQFPPELLEQLVKEIKLDFMGLRGREDLVREKWKTQTKKMGKETDLRFVHLFLVTERNNRNESLAGDVPLRSRYYSLSQ